MDPEKKQLDLFEEDWIRWEPVDIKLANNYYLESFRYEDGLKIILKEQGGGQTLQVLFDGQISAMRFADETMRLKLFKDLFNKYGVDFFRCWSFFKAEKSDYLQWLSSQSYEISDFYQIQHFALIMDEDCVIEIMVNYEPEFKILPSSDLQKRFFKRIVMEKNGISVQRNYSKSGQSVYEIFDGATSVKTTGLEGV